MGAEIIEVNTLDPDNDFKKIRVEDKFIEAYLDRYRRLGYVETSRSEEEVGGKNYAEAVIRRDRNQPGYSRLREIEKEIDALLIAADDGGGEDVKKNMLRLILRIMFWAGIAICLTGLVMLICGFLKNIMGLALSGWGFVILGAVAVIVWSFLRESWRLRKIDEADDREFPGFGIDEISKKIEEKLLEADGVRSDGHTAEADSKV